MSHAKGDIKAANFPDSTFFDVDDAHSLNG